MTDRDLAQLRAALSKHSPRRVVAINGADVVREVPIPTSGRKRWSAALQVLSRLEWTRLELLDKDGGLLCVIEGEAEAAPADPTAELTGRDAALLKLLLAGQTAVLSNRERETQIAMGAMAAAFKVLTDSIGVLAQVHRMTLDAQAQAFTQLQDASAAPPEEGTESGKLVAQLAPMFIAKMLAPSPAPAPAPSSPPAAPNGVKS
jgi:hypothetical protein